MQMLRQAAIIFCFAVAATSCLAQSDAVYRWSVAASGYRFFPDIEYKKAQGQSLKLDVIAIEPLSQPRPTLLFIHGGGWVNGNKNETTLAALPFLAHGMNTVNIDYRLANQSHAPASVEDCRCALRWIYRHAKEYGFDTSKIVVAGESAGGHLALMTAMLQEDAGFDNECSAQEGDVPLKPAAVISYSGPTDVSDMLAGPHKSWFAIEWFGSVANRADLARRLSPINYVRAGLLPVILAHADSDPHVPSEQAARLHAALTRAGVPNQLIMLNGPIHGWALEQQLSVQEQVFDALRQFGVLSSENQVKTTH
jgi:acetyl esterase/lipase